jgi:hypothetical protein
MAMVALWLRSTKPYAADELRYWRGVLREVDRQAVRLEQRDGRRPERSEADHAASDGGDGENRESPD